MPWPWTVVAGYPWHRWRHWHGDWFLLALWDGWIHCALDGTFTGFCGELKFNLQGNLPSMLKAHEKLFVNWGEELVSALSAIQHLRITPRYPMFFFQIWYKYYYLCVLVEGIVRCVHLDFPKSFHVWKVPSTYLYCQHCKPGGPKTTAWFAATWRWQAMKFMDRISDEFFGMPKQLELQFFISVRDTTGIWRSHMSSAFWEACESWGQDTGFDFLTLTTATHSQIRKSAGETEQHRNGTSIHQGNRRPYSVHDLLRGPQALDGSDWISAPHGNLGGGKAMKDWQENKETDKD